MYTISLTTKYTFKTSYSSWEMIEKVSKYIKHVFKDWKRTIVECADNTVTITVINAVMSEDNLRYIDENIPRWAKEIEEAEKKQNKEDIEETKKFLKKYKVPTVLAGKHRSERYELISQINDYIDVLTDGLKNGIPNVSHIDDIEGLTEIFHLLGAGKYKEAYKFARSLDTCTRELIPDSVYELIQSGAWVK